MFESFLHDNNVANALWKLRVITAYTENNLVLGQVRSSFRWKREEYEKKHASPEKVENYKN